MYELTVYWKGDYLDDDVFVEAAGCSSDTGWYPGGGVRALSFSFDTRGEASGAKARIRVAAKREQLRGLKIEIVRESEG